MLKSQLHGYSGNVNPRTEQGTLYFKMHWVTDPGRAYFRRPSSVCATSNGRGGCGLELWNVRKGSGMRGRWSAHCRCCRNSKLAQPCELDFGCGRLLPDDVCLRAHVGVYNCCWAIFNPKGSWLKSFCICIIVPRSPTKIYSVL